LTNRPSDGSELDIADVSAEYVRVVSAAAPRHAGLALRVLDRLSPSRWVLEWYLPWWLGKAFGLDRGASREIVLSNLLGLASIRLRDDLADGEVVEGDRTAAEELGDALYAAALAPYRVRFDARSPFWGGLDARMTEWRAAVALNDGSDAMNLAARGAPLRISSLAVCLLAGRPEAVAPLDRCLEHALEALVLYDHFGDWEADLDSGRRNAFVAATSAGPQLPGTRDRHRSATFVAIMTTDAVTHYFARIDEGLLQSAAIADTLHPPVPPLSAHLRRFAAELREQAVTIRGHYHELADQAAKLLFQTPADARSWARSGTRTSVGRRRA
jgi:hypothetical protein